MSNQLRIFCLVDGEATSNAFPVSASPTTTVGELKDLIKTKIPDTFNGVDAKNLTLWRVSIPIVTETKHQPVFLDKCESKEELLPADELCDVFGDSVPKRNVHVLVQRPAAAKGSTFVITVKDEGASPFPWDVNPSTATVEELRRRIRVGLPKLHPDRNRITIEHQKCNIFPDGGIALLSKDKEKDRETYKDKRDKDEKDKDLQQILKLYLDAKIDNITIDVGFSTKGFSFFNMADVEARIGTQKFEHMQLKKVACDDVERQQALKTLLEVLKYAKRSIGDSSEACMTRFAGLYLMMACSLFPDLYLIPEKSIAGRWGSGPVDYLVESRGAMDASMVGVVETKKGTTFESGFPQNVAQLEATLINRMEHDCRQNGKAVDLVSYGIVTDACQWEFVECRMKVTAVMGNDHGLVVKRKELPVKVNYKDDKWMEQVQDVFGYIVWLFGEMSSSITSPKRLKEE